MLTIEKLRSFGANVDDFYLRLVNIAINDTKLTELEQQLSNNDLDSAFETAHALKGVYSNLSLTPLTIPISEMVSLLRNKTDTDYSKLLNEAKTQFQILCNL